MNNQVRMQDLQVGNVISKSVRGDLVIEKKEVIRAEQGDLPEGFALITTRAVGDQRIKLENGKLSLVLDGETKTTVIDRRSDINVRYDLHN